MPAASRSPRSSKRRSIACSPTFGAGGAERATVGLLGLVDSFCFVRLHALDRELVHALGLLDPLQVALPEREDRHALGQRGAEERPRRLGEQDVPAAGSRADSRCADDVEPEIALLADGGFAGV